MISSLFAANLSSKMTALRLFSRTLGSPEAPRVLVAHGLAGSGRNWLTAAEGIAQAGFCVELLDLRDHGQSPWSDDLGYAALAQDILAHVVRSPGPLIFLGHSMGGKLGMALAAHHSGEINLRGLCVVDSAPRPYTPPYLSSLVACRDLDLAQVHTRADADRLLAPLIPDERFRQFLLSNLGRDDAGGFRWSCHWELIARDLPKVASNPLSPADHWAGPVLFIAGSRSQYFLPLIDEAQALVHFPSARVEWLPTGHNVHIEAPQDFIKVFTRWALALP